MTLSAAQYRYYRTITGAFDTVKITDTDIQDAYDRAVALDLDTAAMTEARTAVHVLYLRRGIASVQIDARGEVETETRNALFANINKLIAEFEPKAGIVNNSTLGLGTLTTGMMDLGIDTICEDEWAS